MLYWLTQKLTHFYSGFNVFSYLTLRAILAVITALAIALMVGPWMIRRLAHRQIGQVVRSDGPQTHLAKAGTPTMGGALILVAIAAGTLACPSIATNASTISGSRCTPRPCTIMSRAFSWLNAGL